MYFRVKRLEQAWNRLFIRAVGRMMPPAPPGKPDWSEGSYRILYLRHDKIGDMIVSTSLIEAIARSHPTIRLDVLASPANAPVLENNPYVNSVLVWDRTRPASYKELRRKLHKMKYDAVIDCMVLAPSTTTLLLMLASSAKHRIGVGGRINDYALTIRVPRAESAAHHIEHSAVLAKAFDVDIDEIDWRPSLYFSDAELARANESWRGSPRLLVNISAGPSRDRWPDEHFMRVLRHVRQQFPDVDVAVISAPDETNRAYRIATSSDSRFVRTAKVRDALALVATSDFVLTPDTSIAHAASACSKPAVILFQKGKEVLWGRYRIPGHDVVSPEKSLSVLPVEPVLAAVDDLLANCAPSSRESK
ncbi:MAG TPA: glycosyltransferase family 9 protein [Gemmatimonadaceae bacterium]|nr:glycosyltransferase family 9 protein [Gemmatimonadaceae bacterium]